jgi:hypothetical protein
MQRKVYAEEGVQCSAKKQWAAQKAVGSRQDRADLTGVCRFLLAAVHWFLTRMSTDPSFACVNVDISLERVCVRSGVRLDRSLSRTYVLGTSGFFRLWPCVGWPVCVLCCGVDAAVAGLSVWWVCLFFVACLPVACPVVARLARLVVVAGKVAIDLSSTALCWGISAEQTSGVSQRNELLSGSPAERTSLKVSRHSQQTLTRADEHFAPAASPDPKNQPVNGPDTSV